MAWQSTGLIRGSGRPGGPAGSGGARAGLQGERRHLRLTPFLGAGGGGWQYASQNANIQKFYLEGRVVQTEDDIGNVIHPLPDYFKAADGYGGAGERASQISALASGILRAVQSVKSEQTYILDVLFTP
jgi:hypothetical protein